MDGLCIACVEPHWKKTRTDRCRWKNRYTAKASYGQNDAQKTSSRQLSVTTEGEQQQGQEGG